MLARTFLPAANLKITNKQHSALVSVLLLLEGGEVEWRKIEHRNLRRKEKFGFNMADWNCGTAACIGGWADTFGARFHDRMTLPAELERLFYPMFYLTLPSIRCMTEITVPQAARALRNYLERGTPDWDTVLA